MAARLNRGHQDTVRQKIQASQLVNRLQNHVDGKVELTASQLKAIEILLDRSLPKLSAIQHTGEDGGPIATSLSVKFVG